MGGAPGFNGCSGYGGAGGAASVVEVGSSASSPTSVGTVVAGGGGGDGGSGQYSLVRGQIGLASYVPQSTPTPITYGIPAGCTTSCTSHNTIESPSPLPAFPTLGQAGTAVFTMCGGDTNGNSADQFFNTGAPNNEAGCDGGGGAGGGGGAAGGAAGNDEFGSGSSDEWYGQGGSPGENDTGGFPGLTAVDSFYSDADTGVPSGTGTFADPGAAFDGSVVITYATGIPAAPTSVAGSAGNGTVALQWAAPISAGAAPISDYIVQYSSNGGSTWTTDDTGSTTTSTTVSGLTNGTGYIFEVQAVNSIGDGPFSSPSGTLTPSGPPGAPTITSITPRDGALLVNFSAPSGSAPITGYVYQLDGTGPWFSSSATSSPLTIPGLTDGTPYSVQIEAVSTSGTGAPSNSVVQTPVAVRRAHHQLGPGRRGHRVDPVHSREQWWELDHRVPLQHQRRGQLDLDLDHQPPGPDRPVQRHVLRLRARGGQRQRRQRADRQQLRHPFVPCGTGYQDDRLAESGPGGHLRPPGDRGVAHHRLRLVDRRRLPLVLGELRRYPVPELGWVGRDLWIDTLSVDGATALANGTAYPIEMRAVNAVGSGSASGAQSGTPYTTPDAPTITTGANGMVAADQELSVSFTAPAGDGGSVITGYQYSTDAGATWHDRIDGQPATSTTMTVSALSTDGLTPLTNGTTYNVEIRAVNAAGDGPGSAVAVGIPVTVPDAPTISSVTSENGALGIAFTSGSNGGSAVTSYQYSVDGQTWTDTGTLSPGFTISGLVNGTSYSVQVRALNSVGTSAPSVTASGTPTTTPGRPAITATSRGNDTIFLTYSEPSTGGSPILSYQYSTDAGTTWSTVSTADPMVITALSTDGTTPVSNGTTYPVEIRAVNGVGDSLASSPVNVSPASAPAAPGVVLTPANGAIVVQATVSDNGGSPVTGLDYSVNGAPFVSTGTTSSTFSIPGLVNGTSYSITVGPTTPLGTGHHRRRPAPRRPPCPALRPPCSPGAIPPRRTSPGPLRFRTAGPR